MTRTPFDAFSKDLLEELLSPYGQVAISQEVPGESRLIDIYFIPTSPPVDLSPLGVLGQITTTPCLIEPFRNPPTRSDIRNCLLKLFLVYADIQRQDRREDERTIEANLPSLWILSPSASEGLLTSFNAQPHSTWLSGIHFLSEGFHSAIIAINQLPITDDTLWLRLLGRGPTQQQAITEVLNLPADDPRRIPILELLVNWKISLELTGIFEQEEQRLMATLSQAYLDWKQRTQQEAIEQGIEQGIQQGIEQGRVDGERSLILRLLTRKVGELPPSLIIQIEALSIPQLEALGEALLDFTTLIDLESWLITHLE